MEINDKDFYASHGLDFDIEKMQIEYTKRVIRQAKIEVLTELQKEIEEIVKEEELIDKKWANGLHYSEKVIQQKIDKLKEGA
jgi:DNA-binding response OmpR family regulator